MAHLDKNTRDRILKWCHKQSGVVGMRERPNGDCVVIQLDGGNRQEYSWKKGRKWEHYVVTCVWAIGKDWEEVARNLEV